MVARFLQELFARGRLEVVDDYLTRDFVDHNPLQGFPGNREGLRETAGAFRRAFPDWRHVPHELIAERDLVVARFAASGTHRGVLLNIPPTGRSISVQGISIFRLERGRIKDRWGLLDQAALLRQLGYERPSQLATRS